MENTTQIQEGVPIKTVTFRRAYIWQLPVRFFHWINGFAITFLIITGFLIANPPAIMTAKEASGQFWMGLIRQVHFISAYAMVAVMFMRVYWAFVGNRFANWRQFVPFDKKGLEKMWHVIKHDIFLFNEKEYKFTSIPIGHNAVAAASYLVMFILAVVMVFTGFALYAPTSTWFFPKFFAWATSLITTDEFLIRRIHHIVMWAFILFIAVHFYLVLFHDWLEGRGESSAMVSGYKFCRTERFEDYKEEEKH
ncbi:MAG: Ni/Fe-hydrogenase, b-type cytochrome subunit [Weeksellaceae bacterium]|jgi:Ni/Fe-hydrogenase 1 B-type cytochrome subunit|nr:Ni/Fe-hydrogenase, b-type cytochrome subunit [Weeksellaceae bacterium]